MISDVRVQKLDSNVSPARVNGCHTSSVDWKSSTTQQTLSYKLFSFQHVHDPLLGQRKSRNHKFDSDPAIVKATRMVLFTVSIPCDIPVPAHGVDSFHRQIPQTKNERDCHIPVTFQQ